MNLLILMEQLLKHFRGRQKGTPNKLTSEIKDKLSTIINEAIDTSDIIYENIN